MNWETINVGLVNLRITGCASNSKFSPLAGTFKFIANGDKLVVLRTNKLWNTLLVNIMSMIIYLLNSRVLLIVRYGSNTQRQIHHMSLINVQYIRDSLEIKQMCGMIRCDRFLEKNEMRLLLMNLLYLTYRHKK